ncbi:DNA polymerase III subunit alpha [candidate division WOR-1 bacterium RIFOXYA2_FULL_36_21]|uniref:DNA polymerase III subunit alpha n=1 Tax=candidate division WOR-1 bacterium RIFOXYB2_FULL_36_35 TaxID=1802578 RepID=A0A1F4S329_UNCSA|nr:MAG: DNA polymerase III subunit alpha [candidate division WOR-1 bacterium RIFOXYA2_FULL_36_21]OGC14855.1 MAG: DNA polymerase III subunit alpha [candidate division WOR-1 bacterium RIFOXYB2_FULL_36_35]
MPRKFVHLHVHSEYSLLDGASKITELVKRVKELDMSAVALTDHGNMYAAVKFFLECKEHEIKPLIGCELYLAPRSRLDKETKEDRSPFHLTFLAKDEEGYRNLIKLVSLASLEGFYNKPRIDKELLGKYNKGLVCLSGCLQGEIGVHLLNNQQDKAIDAISFYKDLFGDDFYIEIMDMGLYDQKTVNPRIIEVAKKLNVKLVATNDAHYLKREDAFAQDVLLCIGTNSFLDQEKRLRFENDQFYLKSAEEMFEVFKDVPQAIDNTLEVAEKCNFELETGKLHLPNFEVPDRETPNSYLEKLVWDGIKTKYGVKIEAMGQEKLVVPPEINDRVKYELYTIEKMEYAAYFLIVQDFINFARSKGIQVGPGRGSAAGSIISYALGITSIDPLKYGLLFERFLNLERISMPDIDIDFCFERRQEVIDYVNRKYGTDHVAQIVTFGTMAARGAIRDVGRVQRMPLSEVDKIAKMIPFGPKITIEDGLSINKELKALYDSDEKVKNLIETAKKLEGLSRHASVHAAGVVISEKPLMEHLPLQRLDENSIVTQYQMTDLEKIGILKMDFLGLRNLTMIDHAVNIIKERRNEEIDMGNLILNDHKTFSLLRLGETIGVFQLESRGMRGLMKDLQPDNFEEIIALLALYRPGPLESGMVDDYVKRKHKKIPVHYDLPELIPILEETYGVILYQEQVMEIASKVAGFTMGQADVLRAAMGKKKVKEMAKQKELFIEGAVKRNVSKHKATELYNLCAKFAGYGFNKSHSTAYSLISYQTAYLKANYQEEFMAALLTSIMGNTDKITLYISEAQRMKIKVLPPDVNFSTRVFTVVDEGIRFGLTAIKNVGIGAIESILESRKKEGTFKSLLDFCRRVDTRTCNKKVIESLIKSGAMDSFGKTRNYLLSVYERVLTAASGEQKERASGQIFMFDVTPQAYKEPSDEYLLENIEPVDHTSEELLRMEKELLGLYISKHPLENLIDSLEGQVEYRVADVVEKYEGDIVKIGGLLTSIRKITTKKGDMMMVAALEDLSGSIPLVIFPKTYNKYVHLLNDDAVIIIKGKLNRDARTEEMNVWAETVEPLAELEKVRSLHIEVVELKDKAILERLKDILLFYRGNEPVIIYYDDQKVAAGSKYRVDINPELVERIEELLGTGAARVEQRHLKRMKNDLIKND